MNLVLVLALITLPPQVPATAPAGDTVLIRAGQLIDGVADRPRPDQAVLVVGDRIAAVGPWAEVSRTAAARGARVVDLSRATVLPGLIDDHTHLLLQGDATSDDYDRQLLYESIPYRTILAVRNARAALLQGFTTLRDMETEGAMYADVDLKRAIDAGVVPGPRLFVATRALAPTGMYPMQTPNWELEAPQGVQVVDGPDEIVKAVREQVSHGADWIKFYADRAYWVDSSGTLRSHVNFSDAELEALVGEAHRLGRPVAAHAVGQDGIAAALRAGVNSIEHGFGVTDALARVMAERGVYLCPTLYVASYVAPGRGAAGAPIWQQIVRLAPSTFARAYMRGVPIAYGTDAGGFPWTEPEASDFSYMTRAGMPPMSAIRSATSVAAALLGQQQDIGSIAPGRFADIIAVNGNPLNDIEILKHVSFVMKGGVVYKQQ